MWCIPMALQLQLWTEISETRLTLRLFSDVTSARVVITRVHQLFIIHVSYGNKNLRQYTSVRKVHLHVPLTSPFFVSGTFDVFNVTSKQHHSTTLNANLNCTKTVKVKPLILCHPEEVLARPVGLMRWFRSEHVSTDSDSDSDPFPIVST